MHTARVDPLTSDLDLDDGATDTTIEISLARREKRVGEECIWLAFRYQAALQSVTRQHALPLADSHLFYARPLVRIP